MIEHEKEIFSRPARTWFQSEKEKTAAKEAGKATYVQSFPDARSAALAKEKEKEKPKTKHGKYDGLSRRAKRRKMAIEADKEEGSAPVQAAAIRKVKRASRPTKITEPMAKPAAPKSKSKKSKSSTGGKKGGSAFDTDGKSKGSSEGMRAKRVKVNLSKGPKVKGKGGKGKK